MAIAAIRHNNPGNVSLPIKGWTGGGTIVGISGQPGYAEFPDMQTGYNALNFRVRDYINRKGLTSISQLNSIYAEDGNWAAGVSRASGIGINDTLDPNNASQMNSLTSGIIRQETGMSSAALGIDNFGNGEFDGWVAVDGAGSSGVMDGPKGQETMQPWDATNIKGGNVGPVQFSDNSVAATDAQTVQQAQSASQQADAIVAAAAQQAATQAATSQATLQSTGAWLSQTQDWLSNWIVRLFIVLLGLLFIGGALGLLIWKGDSALPKFATT